MADKPLDGFEALLEKVPLWTKEIDDIMKTYSALSRQQAVDLSPQDDARFASPLEALFYRQRIKRTISVYSAAPSVEMPPSSDSGTLVAVSYNGDLQKRFDTLVRAIGSVRNLLRRGKMSVKVTLLPYIAGTASDDSDSDTEDTGIMIPLRTRHGFGIGSSDDTRAFDEVDASLGRAQTQFERAAHRILRGCECEEELSNARDRFLEATSQTEQEMPRLREKLQRQADRQRRRDERRLQKQGRSRDEDHTAAVTAPATTPASMREIDIDVNLDDPDPTTPALLMPRSFRLQTKQNSNSLPYSGVADASG